MKVNGTMQILVDTLQKISGYYRMDVDTMQRIIVQYIKIAFLKLVGKNTTQIWMEIFARTALLR